MTGAGDTSNTDKTTFTWMANIVEALEKLGAPLQHVYFTQGYSSQILRNRALQLQLQNRAHKVPSRCLHCVPFLNICSYQCSSWIAVLQPFLHMTMGEILQAEL